MQNRATFLSIPSIPETVRCGPASPRTVAGSGAASYASGRSARCNESECLANAHAERVAVPALRDVRTKIDVIFFA